MTTIIRLNPTNKNGIQGVVLEKGIAILNTIEKPWIPSPDHKGGMNFHSCVSCGDYEAIPFDSPKYGHVFLLYNPDLDVYLTEEEADAHGGGRWLIIFGHVANKPENVQGCQGLGLGWYDTFIGVSKSKDAVERYKRIYGWLDQFTVTIGEYK